MKILEIILFVLMLGVAVQTGFAVGAFVLGAPAMIAMNLIYGLDPSQHNLEIIRWTLLPTGALGSLVGAGLVVYLWITL